MTHAKNVGLSLLVVLFACAPAPQPVGVVKNVGMQPIGRLADGKQSTVLGVAKLTNFNNGRTVVDVELSNLMPRQRSAGAIFKGTCANRTPSPTLLLNEIGANDAGAGETKSEIETAKLPVPAYIVYYQRGRDESGGIGDPVTCGDVR